MSKLGPTNDILEEIKSLGFLARFSQQFEEPTAKSTPGVQRFTSLRCHSQRLSMSFKSLLPIESIAIKNSAFLS